MFSGAPHQYQSTCPASASIMITVNSRMDESTHTAVLVYSMETYPKTTTTKQRVEHTQLTRHEIYIDDIKGASHFSRFLGPKVPHLGPHCSPAGAPGT